MQLRIVQTGSARKPVFVLELDLPAVTGASLADTCEGLGIALDDVSKFMAQAAIEVGGMAKTAKGRQALAAGFRFGQF